MPDILQLNLVSHLFYDKIVPYIMIYRNLYSSITTHEIHIFEKEGTIYKLDLTKGVATREVDFNDDKWRHDDQYEIIDENVRPQPLFKVSDLVDHPDPDVKVNEDEEIQSEYVVRINRSKFLVWPLKGALKLCRGVFINIDPYGKFTIKRTSEPPCTILKPGISFLKREGEVLFLGGNQQKMCHYYNITNDQWRTAGVLPTFHLVT